MEIFTLITGIVSILSGIAAWHYGTKRRRGFKAMQKQLGKLEKITNYTSQEGYKFILRDCFHTFSYSLAIIFIPVGIFIFIYSYFPNHFLKLFFVQLLSSVFVASGLMLLEMFNDLSKTLNPEESIKKIKERIEKLKNEHENH
jgi:hypothetical protein